tara:strand:+ start:794 stop:1669 length:876 start_codon:yes stop_codon:yes gene_type:complete
MALTKVPNELSSTPSIVDGGNATAITITSDEHVLVGKSSDAFGTAGIALRGTVADFIRDGGTPINVNRLTDDGHLITLHKGNAVIGSLGSTSGSMYIQGNPATGKSGLTFFGSYIEPRDNGSAADNAIDLGSSTSRFKDLYLSGGVNFSANANASGMSSETLSDYEEGVCTLTWSGSGGTANSTNTEFKYVKVGNLVSINGYTATTLPNATGTLELTGLPFAAVGSASGSILYRNLTAPSGAHTLICFLGNGSARFQPFWAAQGTYVQLNSSHINSNNAQDMYLSINYRTS